MMAQRGRRRSKSRGPGAGPVLAPSTSSGSNFAAPPHSTAITATCSLNIIISLLTKHHLLTIMSTTLLSNGEFIPAATAQEALLDNFFCGTSWSDASSNCDDRQPCPNGLEEQCTQTPGQLCFADTLCSVAAGHGEKFKYIALMDLVDLDYDDASNKMFCGGWWGGAEESCSSDNHCPDGECSNAQEHCFETSSCNIQDILKDEMGEDWKEKVTGVAGGGGSGGGSVKIKMSEDDPRRNQYCGLDWAQASSKCLQWCKGDDSPDDCPKGQKCFADTLCYYDDDLQPTMSPIVTWIPTKSPTPRDDPSNGSFCGESWALAIQNCSPKTHCKDDSECTKEGHECYPNLPGCNLVDMAVVPVNERPPDPNAKAAPYPPNDAKNYRFCGRDWNDAADNCNLARHCPEMVCEDPGLSCFVDLQYTGAVYCNAHDMYLGRTRAPSLKPSVSPTVNPTPAPSDQPTMPNPTESPTNQPIKSPSKSPTYKPTKAQTKAPVQIIYGLCAQTYAQLQLTYRTARECSNIDPCDEGQICYPNVSVETFAKPPSLAPSSPLVSPPPTHYPTYWYSYSPTKIINTGQYTADQASIVQAYPTMAPMEWQEKLTAQRHTQNPTAAQKLTPPAAQMISTRKPTTHKGDAPMASSNESIILTVQNKSYFCVASVKDLEVSCDSAPTCDFSKPCPPGLGCVQYNGCEQKQQQIQEEKPQQQKPPNPGAVWNLFPDLCPLGLVGMHATADDGDCRQYYECRDGFLEASHMCELGLMFDNRRGECVSQTLVNSKCESIDKSEDPGENDGQNLPIESGGEGNDNISQPDLNNLESEEELKLNEILETNPNYLPDICPMEFMGSYAKDDCSKYYECENMLLVGIHACAPGLMFDNDGGSCISQYLVNDNCTAIPYEIIEEEQYQETYSGGKTNDNLASFSVSENDAKLINDVQNQLNGPGKGTNSNSSQLDSVLNNEAVLQMSVPPSDNTSSPDLCPVGFNGLNAKKGCTEYYVCTDGIIRTYHNCTTNYKFDKVRGRCIAGQLVSEYCYGPALGEDEKQNLEPTDEEQNTIPPKPSPSPTPIDRATTYPKSEGGTSITEGAPALSDTTSAMSSESDQWTSSSPDQWGLWVKQYGESGGRRISIQSHQCLWMMSILSMFWALRT